MRLPNAIYAPRVNVDISLIIEKCLEGFCRQKRNAGLIEH
jgi:hypothetical protein